MGKPVRQVSVYWKDRFNTCMAMHSQIAMFLGVSLASYKIIKSTSVVQMPIVTASNAADYLSGSGVD